jgi:hypothetical protein
MAEKGNSYLAGVKEELRKVVQEVSEEEEIDEDGIVNRIWKLFEMKLKESFLNGKKASGNGSPSEKRNSFRRR